MNQSSPLRILLVNNIPTHHQSPLAQSLYQLLGENFRFACYSPLYSDRAAMGWQDNGMDLPWMIRAWESERAREEYHRWLIESDVVIGFPENFQIIKERISAKKLCLPATERPFKPSDPLWGLPPKKRKKSLLLHILSYYRNRLRLIFRWYEINSTYCHVLTIGTYCPWDFYRLGVFNGRMWTYGYFVDVPSTPPQQKIGEITHILWAGRMLDWKRVDVLIKACGLLFKKKLNFRLDLIGDGPERSSLKRLVDDLGMQGVVSFSPPVSPAEVRKAMKSAQIFVIPSTQEEGWGAVVGEAMGEGCAVVAASGAGAAHKLVQHGNTGYIIHEDDVNSLALHMEEFIQNPEKAHQMGKEGWQYMNSIWNPGVVAQRLLELINGLLKLGEMPQYANGPCSPAIVVKP
jgi:glycosyltransferase involved in cell wall biosynthesis